MRILVVDDEPALRDSVARSLRFEGYAVVTAPDGAEALARLPEVRPDAVVVDVMMPRLNGIELCRRMREAGDRTPVLMLTARNHAVVRPFTGSWAQLESTFLLSSRSLEAS